jgi:hypothetical protein
MSTSQRIKNLLVQTVYKKAARSAAEQIIKSPEPNIQELDIIAYKHIIGLLIPRAFEKIRGIPRAFEKIRGDWEWATGAPIPISMHDALEYYEKHVEERG